MKKETVRNFIDILKINSQENSEILLSLGGYTTKHLSTGNTTGACGANVNCKAGNCIAACSGNDSTMTGMTKLKSLNLKL